MECLCYFLIINELALSLILQSVKDVIRYPYLLSVTIFLGKVFTNTNDLLPVNDLCLICYKVNIVIEM